jgi:hypothetical protein
LVAAALVAPGGGFRRFGLVFAGGCGWLGTGGAGGVDVEAASQCGDDPSGGFTDSARRVLLQRELKDGNSYVTMLVNCYYVTDACELLMFGGYG